jgi:predicted RNase H-like HicB family nuclease
MEKIKFIVQKTDTGYSAYFEDKEFISVVTVGDTMAELKANMVEAYNLFAEETQRPLITEEDLAIKFDLVDFFDYYKPEINARGLAKRVGMNEDLLYQYISGHKKASEKQEQRILAGIRQMATELLDFA